MKEERVKKMKRFEAHATEDSDQEVEEVENKDEDSSEEYALISTLIGLVSPGNDTWLIDSGASKHMTGFKESLACLEEKEYLEKVFLGYDSQYPIKGLG